MKKAFVLVSLALLCTLQSFSQGYSGLVGRWTFDGNANDVSGNGLNGIVYGATLTTGISGLPNTAYQFNGTSNYIAVPSNSLMNTKVHSFCALVKPNGFYSGDAQGNSIIWRGADLSSTFSYQLEFFDNAYDNSDGVYSPTQDVFAGWTGSTTSSTPQTEWYYTPTVVANTWYNVVLTYDGDTTKIYVNGTLMTRFYNTCTFAGSTDTLFFGKSGDDASFPYWLNGVVDEIRFYNRVLTPSEVTSFGDSLGIGKILPLKFYLDANGDCMKESSEQYNMLPVTIEVDSNGISVDTLSATSSLYYYANGNQGDIYSFKVISSAPGIFVSCPASGIIYDTLRSGINPTNYVGFSCNSSTAFDLQENLGVSTDVHAEVLSVLVSNNYCTPEPAVLTMNFSPKVVFGSAAPAPATVTGNTATWNLGSVFTLNSPTSVHVTLNVSGTPLSPGDTIMTECVVNSTGGDTDTTNNIIIKTDTIRACMDPNEMEVIPAGNIPSGTVTSLQYTIQFENTGNDTAHNIYIMDTLSDNVDPHSLRIVAASTVMNVSKLYDNVYHNIYKFEFPYINLLDSSHHNQCSGMVIFNINTKLGLPDGAAIFNHAGIFFDNNSVVMTDTVLDIIGHTVASLGAPVESNINKANLFPNPATDELTIKIDKNAYSFFTICNVMGQQLMQQELIGAQTRVNVKALAPGVYYVTLKGDNGRPDSYREVMKFVKW